jgi:hypothetical protein
LRGVYVELRTLQGSIVCTIQSSGETVNIAFAAIKTSNSTTYRDLVQQLEQGFSQTVSSAFLNDGRKLKTVRLMWIDVVWDVEDHITGWRTDTFNSHIYKLATRLNKQSDEKVRLILRKMGARDRFVIRYEFSESWQ